MPRNARQDVQSVRKRRVTLLRNGELGIGKSGNWATLKMRQTYVLTLLYNRHRH